MTPVTRASRLAASLARRVQRRSSAEPALDTSARVPLGHAIACRLRARKRQTARNSVPYGRHGIRTCIVLLLAGVISVAPFAPVKPSTTHAAPAVPAVRFTYVDLYIDSGAPSLGAYQLDLTATAGQVLFVGVEGGAHPAFNAAPYYDPHGMTLGHLVLAAYSVSHDLPHGKTRVARVHVQITGDAMPAYAATLTVAADATGRPIPAATLSVSEAPLEGVAP